MFNDGPRHYRFTDDNTHGGVGVIGWEWIPPRTPSTGAQSARSAGPSRLTPGVEQWQKFLGASLVHHADDVVLVPAAVLLTPHARATMDSCMSRSVSTRTCTSVRGQPLPTLQQPLPDTTAKPEAAPGGCGFRPNYCA